MDENEGPAPPTFVANGRSRSEIVPLEWPVEFDGKVWDKITVSRMTAAQVDAFTDALKVTGDKTPLPMFDAPVAVIEALDADDSIRLNEVVSRFLPRALQSAEQPLTTQEEPSR